MQELRKATAALMALLGLMTVKIYVDCPTATSPGFRKISTTERFDKNNIINKMRKGFAPVSQKEIQKIDMVSKATKRRRNRSGKKKKMKKKKSSSSSFSKGEWEKRIQKHRQSVSRPSDAHPVAGLSCQAHGGPNNEDSDDNDAQQVVNDMVYWRDLPEDAKWQSTFRSNGNQKKKYLTFEPDEGGFNNVRMAFETALTMAIGTGRILVLPPEMSFYLLTKYQKGKKSRPLGFSDFYDLQAIAQEHLVSGRAFQMITFQEFLETEAMAGTLLSQRTGRPSFPPQNITNWNNANYFMQEMPLWGRNPLWNWMRKIAVSPDWDYENCVAVIPRAPGAAAIKELEQLHALNHQEKKKKDGSEQAHADRLLPVNASAKDRLAEMLAGRKELCIYNETMQNAQVVHLQGDAQSGHGTRMLVHFYAFIFFQDWQHDLWTKRFVRDHLRYHDDIQCAAARIVQAIRKEARIVNRNLRAATATKNNQNLAGATEMESNDDDDASFHTMHIRRGDFQYEDVRLTAEQIYEDNVRNWFTPGKVVFVATDEKDMKFFDPLRKHYRLLFLKDYQHLLTEVDYHNYGMIDQLVASMGDVFVGAYFSTFSGYIQRLRGYHSQKSELPGFEKGELRTSYYYAPDSLAFTRLLMQEYKPVKKEFWEREFPVAWRDLDNPVASATLSRAAGAATG